MSAENFSKFYEEYVPKHSELSQRIDGITNEQEFAKVAVAEGQKAGYDFKEDDVHKVMKASEQAILKGELKDGDLDSVVGGATSYSFSTVSIRSADSLNNLSTRKSLSSDQLESASASTVMCCW